jgi:hypothetical protein
VLPGPAEPSPLIGQKLPPFDKNTPLFKIFAKFRYSSAIFSIFCTLTLNFKASFHTFPQAFLYNYLSKQNSAIFLLLLAGTIAAPLSRLLHF